MLLVLTNERAGAHLALEPARRVKPAAPGAERKQIALHTGAGLT